MTVNKEAFLVVTIVLLIKVLYVGLVIYGMILLYEKLSHFDPVTIEDTGKWFGEIKNDFNEGLKKSEGAK